MRSFFSVACLAATSLLFYTPEADACGGCFPPQGETASIVTDHRMVMTVSTEQSTLYDQIRYQGSPSEFAWILPISGTVEVGISADSLFGALDSLTSVFVQQPPTNCPTFGPECGQFSGSSGASAGGSSGTSGATSGGTSGGPVVLKQEVVGPYDTVQLKPGADPSSVYKWLTDNKYNLTDDLKPIIQYYTNKSFNFLALRLKPGANVQSMRPIRVTTPGAGGSTTLPLRMVAAGTGASVGITLWVVANGRYEPTNFESFLLKDEDIAWDWGTNASNYKDLRAQRQNGGKAWEVESVITTFGASIEQTAYAQSFQSGGGGPEGDYLATGQQTAAEVRSEDFEVLQKGLSGSNLRVTRLRADLSRAALENDLSIGASTDQNNVPTTRLPRQEIGQPLCNVIKNCQFTGERVPRDEAYRKSTGSISSTSSSGVAPLPPSSGATPFAPPPDNGACTCRTTPIQSDAGLWIAIGFVGLTFVRAVGKRRRS